ncbi:hypothetical protein COCON_G00082470 [Conger conger]|uniref:RING-type domain-containing protein n=1 Tax=Conger conger TaxID=82655 RepID=A0A9Q1DPU8_CONCO|nr:E3 ubiquitin-protein ligase RNF128a isoform X1 [Conger conger]KAJ8276495.1 hypothetical protein COCON_G00082470 [Conger conger]
MEPHTKRYLFSWLFVAYILQVSSLHFAQGTYICTAYLNVSFFDPETNETFWRQEESGLYGQDSPKETVTGEVFLPEPIHSCELETSYDVPSDAKGWIALIQRGHGCTFTEKINIAASKGAAAAVIYNEPGTENRVIQMSHPGTGDTVAIMIGHTRGMEIVSLIKRGIAVTMSIEVGKQHGGWMGHYSVFFVSISFFVVTAATVGYFIFYSARRLNSVRLQSRKQRQLKAEAKKAIGKLQVRTVKQGDEETGPDADTCAVCIEAYKAGDVLSILTCNHFFHKTCIEPWLLEHRTCPMCKCDILKALGIEPEDDHHGGSIPPDFRSYPSIPEETRSETASSGYASVQGSEEHPIPTESTTVFETAHEVAGQNPEPEDIQMDSQPHYDNLAFEEESRTHTNPRT